MTELETVREYLDYSPDTGRFTWKKPSSPKSHVGANAGSQKSKNGYWQLTLKGKYYYVHRLAWFHFYGELPTKMIDHVNGDKGDNRIMNLRLASLSENLANVGAKRDNTSGAKNVHWCNSKKRWIVKVKRNGKTHHAGTFREYAAAVNAAETARLDVHGEFASQLGCDRDAAMCAWAYRGAK